MEILRAPRFNDGKGEAHEIKDQAGGSWLVPGTIAMAGASVLLIFESRKIVWADVEWTTIFFFIGLFIMVGAVVKTGSIHLLGHQFLHATGGNSTIMPLALLWISGFFSAVIDNIPYTAAMIPLVESLKEHCPNIQPLWWALALGSCLGGNGSLVGATANVVVAEMACGTGNRLSFLEFVRIGGLITVQSLLISSIYLYFRYLQ